ncbi:hypothetical protein Nepgr_021118 [Nepenthes gracilis]|uniref:Uncharacterized protein n=1 Tax=Nepenthes gracilis TaxID=150966 RepID=A0AAD3SZ77_NEPGR|nr:hypothetical protein Nepgr_021118 [Nepenthes gracilis]
MEEECGSMKIPRSEPKVMVGEKLRGRELGGDSEPVYKRVQMRDLQSVLHSEGIDTRCPTSSKLDSAKEHIHNVKKEASQVTQKDLNEKSGPTHSERSLLVELDPKPLDLNIEACIDENQSCNDTVISIKNDKKNSSVDCEPKFRSLGGSGLDLNTEDISGLVDLDPFYPYKTNLPLKCRDESECGSSTGPLGDKDPLRIWKEMKQNGFLSPSYGGIPVPKQRGRKSKNDVLKKKMEQAKKEQVDKLAKIAGPSGLLNGLNPGIINHVRNSKQVCSIIKAIVGSEKHENRHIGCKQASQTRGGAKEVGKRKKESVSFSGDQGSSLSHEAASLSGMRGSNYMHGHLISYCSSLRSNSKVRGGYGDLSNVDVRIRSFPTNINSKKDLLALKLSSTSNTASENTSSLSNAESTNINNVDSLSVQAATIASQWLQLLQQDINGRLAALRNSKKRVQDVIATEIPFLLSKEFSSDQENDTCNIKESATCYSNKATPELHEIHWGMLFKKMDKALSDEEKQLECWLNQVNSMLQHCEQGLQYIPRNGGFSLQCLGTMENDLRSGMEESDRELAVRAAAASIYSTCNFLFSKENMTS